MTRIRYGTMGITIALVLGLGTNSSAQTKSACFKTYNNCLASCPISGSFFDPDTIACGLDCSLDLAACVTRAISASPQTTVDDPFQVHYLSNLNIGDSVINISNTGAQNTAGGALTDICANVYAFSPDEQMISCCSCNVTPNALVSLSARNDLISNTLTPAVPTSIVVKIVATSGTACNAALPGRPTFPQGLVAWATTLHALPTTPVSYSLTETPFTDTIPSFTELARLSGLCGFIQANGSGFGICRSCRLGGLGAVAQ